MIVVMPNGNPNCQAAPGEWSWGMYTPGFRDSGTGPTAPAAASIPESFMDIVNYVDANYRTLKDRSHRAICGLSMGGGHTFHVSLLYPTKFDYYGLFSAGLHLANGGYQDSFAMDSSLQACIWPMAVTRIRLQIRLRPIPSSRSRVPVFSAASPSSTGWVWVRPTSSIRAPSTCAPTGTRRATNMSM